MPERKRQIDAFLERAGWGRAERRLLAGDASFRRYERLFMDDRTAVLMDAPPPQEDVRPFIAIARHLLAEGYSAPDIYANDVAAGFLLLEDLGDDCYTRLLDGPTPPVAEQALYEAAVDLLIALHRRAAPTELAPFDVATLLAEVELFIDWYVPRRRGGAAPSKALRQSYARAWRDVLPLAQRVPNALVLRDYHADNLMWLPARGGARDDPNGVKRVGLLDFQDAVRGPVSYDLVSLLEDARRDVPPAIAAAMIRRYLAANPALDEESFGAAYAVLGAQRNLRIVGVFSRLCARDGKAQYLALLPRVWGLVEHDIAHPALAPVKAWLDREIPPDQRERAP